jgi:hypothetical protein
MFAGDVTSEGAAVGGTCARRTPGGSAGSRAYLGFCGGFGGGAGRGAFISFARAIVCSTMAANSCAVVCSVI